MMLVTVIRRQNRLTWLPNQGMVKGSVKITSGAARVLAHSPLLSKLDKQIDPDTAENLDLTRLIPLGWSVFRWISTLIIIPVFTFLSQFISNYGIIILLTWR